jgi:16S rRNA (guanine(966)-N(2))-methyltransferase RsmD
MGIRVIAGTAKGRQLKLVPGDTTRPIMDRVKESLFNIIGRDIIDAQFLDLFAGTGSVGIEALSRGAAHATFVDLEKRAIQTVKENLALTKFTPRATITHADAFIFLEQGPKLSYNFIYIAPPQYKDLWLRCLQQLDERPTWLHPELEVIVQIDPAEEQPLNLARLEVVDQRRYGNTLLLFLHPKVRTDAESLEE